MDTLQNIQSLRERLNMRPQSMQDLVGIFEDYKTLVAGLTGAGGPYGSALRHTHEEYPDLQRLIGKGHDAVLKGRLIDAVTALRKKAEAIETPAVPEAPASEPAASAEASGDTGEKPKWRNTPTIGMD